MDKSKQNCTRQQAVPNPDRKGALNCTRQQAVPNPDRKGARYWARHGSTRYLWKSENLESALHYVKEEQGDIMTFWESQPVDVDCISIRPIAYLITFNTYGTWLQGDSRGWVDDDRNKPSTSRLPYSSKLYEHNQAIMSNPPFFLDETDQQVVLKAIIEVCCYRHWHLHAIHIRTSHVHVIVSADARPEKVMNDFKAYASRALNRLYQAQEQNCARK